MSESLHPHQPPEKYSVRASPQVLVAKCKWERQSSLAAQHPCYLKKKSDKSISNSAVPLGLDYNLKSLVQFLLRKVYRVTGVWWIQPGCTLDTPRHHVWTKHWSPKVYVITLWAGMQALHIKRDCFLARPVPSITISKWRGILLTMIEEARGGHSAIMGSRVRAWRFFPSLPAVLFAGLLFTWAL